MVLKSGLMYGGSPGLHALMAPAMLPAVSPSPLSPLSKHAAVPGMSTPTPLSVGVGATTYSGMYSRNMLPESSSRNMTLGLIDEVAVPRGSVARVRVPDSTAVLKPSAPATESAMPASFGGWR